MKILMDNFKPLALEKFVFEKRENKKIIWDFSHFRSVKILHLMEKNRVSI